MWGQSDAVGYTHTHAPWFIVHPSSFISVPAHTAVLIRSFSSHISQIGIWNRTVNDDTLDDDDAVMVIEDDVDSFASGDGEEGGGGVGGFPALWGRTHRVLREDQVRLGVCVLVCEQCLFVCARARVCACDCHVCLSYVVLRA